MSAELNINLLGSDEEDVDNETSQRQVLFVPSIEENEDLSGPPMDGFQFLKRVVKERKGCDVVVAKKVETKPQKNIENQILDFPEEKCSPEFCMDKKTQHHIISEFSKLRLIYEARRTKIPEPERKKLSKAMPHRNHEEEWLKILSNTPPNIADSMDLQNSSVEFCLAISQPKISTLLEYMDDWISKGELSVPLVCQWIYTLLACLELPLDPDVCATLRGIARTLISRRARLESLASEELPHINIVICLIGRYLNQLDLADPMD